MSGPQPSTRAAPAYAPPASQRTNRMAIWSLVLSVITLGGLGSLAGIVLGFAARRRISESGERGRGLAIAGVIIGVLTLVLMTAYWAFLAMHTGAASGGGGGGGTGYGY